MIYEIRCHECSTLLAQIEVGRHKPMKAYCPKCDPLRSQFDDEPRKKHQPRVDIPDFMKGIFGYD